MYALCRIRDTVRVPPKDFSAKLDASVLKMVQEEYEGIVDEDLGVIIAVTGASDIGEGKVVPGDGAAYYDATLDLLVYKPVLQEVVEGEVSEITEFGAFVRVGPIEGLVHVSQVMDDFINYDPKSTSFIGKKTGRKLSKEESVLARVVTASLKGNVSNSKMGLTMRQPHLGKEEWAKADEKARKKKESEPPKVAPKGRPKDAKQSK